VLADVAIVWMLWGWAPRGAWVYALHPVALLVTGFHGQFDSLMLFFILLALKAQEAGSFDKSAWALAGAIATKSLPVLLLPFFLLARPTWRLRVRYAALAILPVVALLLPYAVADL